MRRGWAMLSTCSCDPAGMVAAGMATAGMGGGSGPPAAMQNAAGGRSAATRALRSGLPAGGLSPRAGQSGRDMTALRLLSARPHLPAAQAVAVAAIAAAAAVAHPPALGLAGAAAVTAAASETLSGQPTGGPLSGPSQETHKAGRHKAALLSSGGSEPTPTSRSGKQQQQ